MHLKSGLEPGTKIGFNVVGSASRAHAGHRKRGESTKADASNRELSIERASWAVEVLHALGTVDDHVETTTDESQASTDLFLKVKAVGSADAERDGVAAENDAQIYRSIVVDVRYQEPMVMAPSMNTSVPRDPTKGW